VIYPRHQLTGSHPLRSFRSVGRYRIARSRGRGGVVLGGDSAAGREAVRDQAFDGDDHGEGLDLGGSAAAGPFGVQVGDFPEAGQDLVTAEVEPAQSFGILLDELLLDGGPMLERGGADTGLDLVWAAVSGLKGRALGRP
jgi:hypothetical protein